MNKEIFYIDIEFGEKAKRSNAETYEHFRLSGLSYVSKEMPREKFLEVQKKVEDLIRKEMGE